VKKKGGPKDTVPPHMLENAEVPFTITILPETPGAKDRGLPRIPIWEDMSDELVEKLDRMTREMQEN
jgi:hypothetical protein